MQIRAAQSKNSINVKLGKLSTLGLNKRRKQHSCHKCSAVIGGKLSITINSHSSLTDRELTGISYAI
jgi:hypothetical protein